MRERVRGTTRDDRGAGDSGSPESGLDTARERAQSLFREADRVARRALSDQSDTFLRESRQEGGE